jgi:hypothetical protein
MSDRDKHNVFDPHCTQYRGAIPRRLHVCINCLVDEHARQDEKRRRLAAHTQPYEVLPGGCEVKRRRPAP